MHPLKHVIPPAMWGERLSQGDKIQIAAICEFINRRLPDIAALTQAYMEEMPTRLLRKFKPVEVVAIVASEAPARGEARLSLKCERLNDSVVLQSPDYPLTMNTEEIVKGALEYIVDRLGVQVKILDEIDYLNEAVYMFAQWMGAKVPGAPRFRWHRTQLPIPRAEQFGQMPLPIFDFGQGPEGERLEI